MRIPIHEEYRLIQVWVAMFERGDYAETIGHIAASQSPISYAVAVAVELSRRDEDMAELFHAAIDREFNKES